VQALGLLFFSLGALTPILSLFFFTFSVQGSNYSFLFPISMAASFLFRLRGEWKLEGFLSDITAWQRDSFLSPGCRRLSLFFQKVTRALLSLSPFHDRRFPPPFFSSFGWAF